MTEDQIAEEQGYREMKRASYVAEFSLDQPLKDKGIRFPLYIVGLDEYDRYGRRIFEEFRTMEQIVFYAEIHNDDNLTYLRILPPTL